MTTMSLVERAGRLSDEVRAEASRVDPVKVVFTALMIPFVVVGYVLAYILRGVWVLVTFVWVATVVGYRAGGGPDLSGVPRRLSAPLGG